jgi:hypothetical protein
MTMAQEKEKYSSIFEAASKLKKPKSVEDSAAQKKEISSGASAPFGPMTDDEIKERYERCKELHNMIKDKLDNAFAQKNLTMKSIKEYFNSPQHFTDNQWRLIQEQKKEVEVELSKLVKDKAALEKGTKEKSKEARPKVMQTKSRWLPMR